MVTVGILKLIEDGEVSLDTELRKFIPEFDLTNIFKRVRTKTGEVKTSENLTPITIKHLLTHTAGLSYGFFGQAVPLDKIYAENLPNMRGPEKATKDQMHSNLKEFVNKLAELPLIREPGTFWWYSHSFDVLGYLIEVISGKYLDDFLKESIFDKVGMHDTTFIVPEEKIDRVAKIYEKNDESNILIEINREKFIKCLSGGGGLYSTLEDYLKFCEMILHNGMVGNTQILTQKSISTMLSNHLPNGKSVSEIGPYVPGTKDHELWKGTGYGLGGWVKQDENLWKCGVGTYSWMGIANTYFHIDPTNQVISIILPQRLPRSNFTWPLEWKEYINLVYEGLK